MLLVFRKTFLRFSFNGTSSENGSLTCFRQKIRANFDTGRAVEYRIIHERSEIWNLSSSV